MAIQSPTPKMLAELDNGIGWITFNNPERHNAMSMDMWQGLAEILRQLEVDSSLRVVILRGAGEKAFVSGADISEFEKKRNSQEQRDAYEAAFDEAQNRLAHFPKPVIAMIQGYCVGGGLALALNTDIRIATDDSAFAIPAAKLGLGYGYESIKTLCSIVGPSFAKDILFSARFLKTEEALRIGLVNQVVSRDQHMEKVLDYAVTVADNAPLTIKSIKAAVSEIVRDPGQAGPDDIAELVNDCFLSDDYKEGRQAFLEKRKPVFKGS
ncbi:MAG: enoyl-CoA hydratase [Gammaproteobacteria bacterium]|jgi:enoyl-CoA hydratase/carnithine racemase|nr:enoyl-CoA hydratase [Gammaproteobacteria bacterium]MDP6733174.1 enoyl-CoA hydratase [Gammaproteobacteria bacterium]|tara:strand:- start:3272 stop:4072 length:801 start_codon:yes stop_codon:yes gene_type:complete